jgi:uncharacterized protein (DUF58 family)
MRIQTRPGLWLWLGMPLVLTVLLGEQVALFLFYLNVSAWLTSWLWYQGAKGLKVQLKIRQKQIYHGQPLEVEVEGTNSSRLPFVQVRNWLVFNRLSPQVQLGWSNAFGLKPHDTKVICSEIRGLTRGVYQLMGAGWEAVDLLGLSAFNEELEGQGEVVVYPPMLAIGEMDSGIKENPLGTLEMAVGHDVFSPYGVRNYNPGDKLNHIHWKVSAKKGALYTKEFQQVYAREGWLVLYLPREAAEKDLELVITTAASIAGHCIHRGCKLGIVIGSAQDVVIAPGNGGDSIKAILDALARAEYGSGGELHSILGRYSFMFKEKRSVILLAPFLDQEVAKGVEALAKGSLVQEIVVASESNVAVEGQWSDWLASMGISCIQVHNEDCLGTLARGLRQWI